MSYTALSYHLVFSTYCRKRTIFQDHERELYMFMHNFLKARGIHVHRIGGMPDHVHILCDIPAKYAVADIVKLLKCESSKFMGVNPHFYAWEGWSEGYSAFAVDASLRETRRQYIMRQREHHANVEFHTEHLELLRENGIVEIIEGGTEGM